MTDLPRLSGQGAQRLLDQDQRIVITGASGWIGRASMELLYGTLGPDEFHRRVTAFGSSERVLEIRQGLAVTQRPLAELAGLPAQPTVLLHLAFLTKDKVSGMSEEEYRRANGELSGRVLESLDPIGATSVFVASSGAARFADDPNASEAMRLYGQMKRDDEDSFADWAEASGRRAVIARIFALSGPHINKHQTYALASFILDALAKRPIEVRAARPVIRSYVAIRELTSVVFALLLDRGPGVTRFDTGGEPMEMQVIAETVARLLGPVPVRRPAIGNETRDEYVGNGDAYRQLLAENQVEQVSFEQQVLETARFFASEQEHLRVAANSAAC